MMQSLHSPSTLTRSIQQPGQNAEPVFPQLCSESGRPSHSFYSSASTVPAEVTDGRRLVSDDPETAAELRLERGQYRVTALVPYDAEQSIHVREVMKALELDGEFKRVYFYKVNLVPTGEEHEGQPLGRLTAVFHVIDNPIWLVPALYAATAAVSVVGGWFLVDKVETFSKTGIGTILTAAAAAGTLLLLWGRYK